MVVITFQLTVIAFLLLLVLGKLADIKTALLRISPEPIEEEDNQ